MDKGLSRPANGEEVIAKKRKERNPENNEIYVGMGSVSCLVEPRTSDLGACPSIPIVPDHEKKYVHYL